MLLGGVCSNSSMKCTIPRDTPRYDVVALTSTVSDLRTDNWPDNELTRRRAIRAARPLDSVVSRWEIVLPLTSTAVCEPSRLGGAPELVEPARNGLIRTV